MRSFKYHINGLIYNLVYPGFIGSMIYDLIIRYYNTDSKGPYWIAETIVKWMIVIFYCLDFIHLYGDIDRRVKLKDRGIVYFICDVGVALLFFIAYAKANTSSYFLSALLICLVPSLILWYKYVLKIDVRAHFWFAVLGIAVTLFLLSKKLFLLKNQGYNFHQEIVSILIGGFFIYLYYFIFVYKEPTTVTNEWADG